MITHAIPLKNRLINHRLEQNEKALLKTQDTKAGLEGQAELFEAARGAILEAHGQVLAGAQAHNVESSQWAGIFPDPETKMEGQGARLQFWDHHGFLGHVCCASEDEALKRMIEMGFIMPDPGALVRLARTDAFFDGNRRRGNLHWSMGCRGEHREQQEI